MARRLPYQEGDWFLVPLVEDQWAAGRVARPHPVGKIAFVYLFGPFANPPVIDELAALLPSEAVLIGRIADQGLVRREWPVLGHADWRRGDWPLMPFRNVDPITRRVRRVGLLRVGLTAPACGLRTRLSIDRHATRRSAAKGEGNHGIGSATRSQSDALGLAWVGDGWRWSSNGTAMISQDGLRVYRPPSWKPYHGIYQANFERWVDGQVSRTPIANGHLNITD